MTWTEKTLTTFFLGIVLAGCAYTAPMMSPREWDRHANTGPMNVRGEDPTTAGQRVYRALLEQPDLAEFLGKQGEPDTLEVTGLRYGAKSIRLTYSHPARQMIRLEQMRDGNFVAHAPEKIAATPTPAATPRKPKPGGGTKSGTKPVPVDPGVAPAPAEAVAEEPKGPTPAQKVECPISPTRPDCQALCKPGVKLEWCR